MICISRTLKAVPIINYGAMREKCCGGDGTYENRHPMHARAPVAENSALQNKLVETSPLKMRTETHPVASCQ